MCSSDLQFAAAGATTHLVILGVPEVDSWTGCIDRYLSALESGNPARWTPLAAHDAGYRGTPRTLAAARDCPELHRLTVVDRSGSVAHDDVRGADGAWARPDGGPEALKRLRAARDPGAEERVAECSSMVRFRSLSISMPTSDPRYSASSTSRTMKGA